MSRVRPAIAGVLALSVGFGALAASAGADTVTDDALGWLALQQEADGGFEVANFPPFETPDALLAFAAAAQTTSTWSTAEARAAVEGVETGGVDGLDWLDDFAEGPGLNPGTAAKLILLSALPLGHDPTAYDPAFDGTPIDLTADLGTISPGLYNSYLFGRLAEVGLGRSVHQDSVQVICEAEKATGGWSFDGLSGGTNSPDLDSTGFSVMALRAIGVPADDPVLDLAGDYITGSQAVSGAWESFGSADPNSTALAIFALEALGIDPGALTNDPFAWIASQQAVDKHITSPNDGFGVNTFATSQSVQALLLDQDPGADWLPRPAGTGRACLPAEGFSDVGPATWLENAARWVTTNEILTGINGTFQQNGPVSRAHAATWLNAMFGSPGGAENNFPDVPENAWYDAGVDFVTSAPNGPIASGINGRFEGRRTLNRGQAVTWLYAVAGSPDVTGLPATGFTDQRPWFANAAVWAKANGIVTGFNDNTFKPNQNVTRGQMAQWLYLLAADGDAWEGGAELPPTILFSAAP
jgi:hypothetical protein